MGKQIVAGDTESDERQLPSGLQKAKIQRILCLLHTCLYLSSLTSFLLAIDIYFFGFSFLPPPFIAHILSAKDSNVHIPFLHTHVHLHAHIPFHHHMSPEKVNLYIGTHKMEAIPVGPAHVTNVNLSQPALTGNSSVSRKLNNNHNPPPQL